MHHLIMNHTLRGKLLK